MTARRAPFLLCLSALVILSGCIMPIPTDAEILVLEYTLTATGGPDEGEERMANPGGHCARAWIEGDTVVMQRSEQEDLDGDARFLFIDPHLEGQWATLGEEPFVMAFPAQIDAGMRPDPGPWAEIALDDEGIVTVDGRGVTLPHEWQVFADDGGWRIDAHLSEGPAKKRVVPDRMCM